MKKIISSNFVNSILKGDDFIEKFKDFKEFTSSEEAFSFQDEVYGYYCEKYKNFQREVDAIRYSYKNSEFKDGIGEYLGNSHLFINRYLRGIDKECEKKSLLITDIVSSLIYAAPKIPYDMVVYRGIGEDGFEAMKAQITEYGKYMEKGFLSTSLTKEYPSSTYDVLLKIYVHKGSYALGVNNIWRRDSEKEILFPTECVLKPITEIKDKELKRKIYVFEMITQ